MTEIWQLATDHALFPLLLTLVSFKLALMIYQRSGRNVLLQPFLLTCVPIFCCIKFGVISLPQFHSGTTVLSMLLGPATVALAVPLYRFIHAILDQAWLLLTAIVIGATTATASAYLLAIWGGAQQVVAVSVLPKTVTTPIAMEVAHSLGGMQAIAAGCVAITGIVGAIAGPWLFDRMNITDPRVRGLALGLSAHAVGTARAFDESPQTGAYASLGLGITGILIALVLPFVGQLLI